MNKKNTTNKPIWAITQQETLHKIKHTNNTPHHQCNGKPITNPKWTRYLNKADAKSLANQPQNPGYPPGQNWFGICHKCFPRPKDGTDVFAQYR